MSLTKIKLGPTSVLFFMLASLLFSQTIDNNVIDSDALNERKIQSITVNFFDKHKIDFPVFFPIDTLFKSNYKMDLIPQIVLVDFGGIVKNVWPGSPDKKRMKMIERTVCK
jgi:hypothetical protein